MAELEQLDPGSSLKSTQSPPILYEEKESPPEERRAMRLKALGVFDLGSTFETMRVPPGFEKTLAAFKYMANEPKRFMYLCYGGTGNGKTRCCQALVIALYDRGVLCQRHRWSDVVRHLQELMGNREGGYEAFFNDFRNRPRLIIDDVGGGSTLGNWEWGQLEDVINHRLEEKLMTVICTNCDEKEIPPRIISRFSDKTTSIMVLNSASDQRVHIEGE